MADPRGCGCSPAAGGRDGWRHRGPAVAALRSPPHRPAAPDGLRRRLRQGSAGHRPSRGRR